MVYEPGSPSAGSVCGPVVQWDWFVLDLSYVLLLFGGSFVLRARAVPLMTWVGFGAVSAIVGGILFAGTYHAQTTLAETAETMDAVALLAAGC